MASIVAFGGVGKSALVNAWLARMDRDGWRGAERVYGLSFFSQGTDRLTASDELVDAALRWFGDPAPEKGSPWDKGERLAALVREKRTILVLDGLEPLQSGPTPGVEPGKIKDPALHALIKELGAQNEGLCLISTRIPVADLQAVGGDRVRSRDLGRLSPEAGAALLRARGANGTEEELRAAASEYDGHSLALTLLGSYLADVAEGDIRRRKEIGPLEEDERHGRHAQSVMAAYEPWLGRPEVAILRVLGLFDKPADEEEIAAVRADPPIAGLTDALVNAGGRDWNKAVAKLRRAGLVLEKRDERLDAHPLVREHFGEQLRREQREAWREGHRRLYVYLAGKAKELPETIEEMAPLYAAVVHGCLAGKEQEAVEQIVWKRIDRNVRFSTRVLGAVASHVAMFSVAFDPPWERLAPGLSRAAEAWITSDVGFALKALGRLQEAALLLRTATEHHAGLGAFREAADSASNLCELLMARGDLRDGSGDARGGALAAARWSVDLAKKSGDASIVMRNRATKASVLHARGERRQAAAVFAAAANTPPRSGYALLTYVRGFRYWDFLLDQGRERTVMDQAPRVLEQHDEEKLLFDIALDHISLGRAHLRAVQRHDPRGKLSDAATHLAASVDGFRRAGRLDFLPFGLLARAALHTHTGDFALARGDLDEALALAQRCGFRLHEADAYLGKARLAFAEGSRDAARDDLANARAIITATGYHRRDAELANLAARLA